MNIRKFLFKIVENWPVKALSILFAIILFAFHRMNTLSTRPLSVPLTIETNTALVPASAYPRTVRVTLRGEDNGVKSILDNDIEAFVDLTAHEVEGAYRASVQIRKKGSALGIEPLEIAVNPLEISVQLDRRISKILPLAAAIQGRVADGFDLTSYSINPAEIVLVGPLSLLERVMELKTDTIELDGRNSDFTMEVGIINPNPLFTVRGNGTAEFSGNIRPSVLVRSIENIPILLIGLAPDFEANIHGKTGSVRIGGDESLLDNFVPPPGFFTVDCSGLARPGTYLLPVTINLPPAFSLIRREPDDLELTIILKPPSEDSSRDASNDVSKDVSKDVEDLIDEKNSANNKEEGDT